MELVLRRLAALTDVLHRRWPWVVVPAVLFGGVALLVSVVFQDPVYRAESQISISESPGRGSLRPQVLPPPAYQRMLRSQAMLNALRERLDAGGADLDRVALRVGDGLRSRVITSRRGQVGNAAFIELQVRAGEAELAAAVANAWAELLEEQDRAAIRRTALENSFDEVEDQLARQKEKIWRQETLLAANLAELEQTPERITVRRSLGDGGTLAARAAGSSPEEIGRLQVVSEELNPLWVRLESSAVVDRVQLEAEREELRRFELQAAGIRQALAELTGKEPAEIAARTEEERAAATAAASPYLRRIDKLRGAARLINPAAVPDAPTSTSKLFGALLAALAGAILGLLAAAYLELRRLTIA